MIVLVGGQSRKVGKSSVVAALIAALPEFAWTAIKIARHEHGSGWGVSEERRPGPTDTGRFLAAGARRALWMRVAPEQMAHAAGEVRRIAAAGANVIVESNSVAEFLAADVTLMVLDGRNPECKPSARRLNRRADALVVAGPLAVHEYAGIRRFAIEPPQYVTEAIAAFVRERLSR